jgi:hypothetical protein
MFQPPEIFRAYIICFMGMVLPVATSQMVSVPVPFRAFPDLKT